MDAFASDEPEVEFFKELDINPFPDLKKSFVVLGLENCLDISFVSPNRIWVNGGETLFLTNTSGDILHKINGSYTCTANKYGMMYINRDFNILKFSYEKKKSYPFIRNTSSWLPRSIYWCPSNGDLLVGMNTSSSHPFNAMVVRYSIEGDITQIIHQGEGDPVLYIYPRYITENNNGDIVVSDLKKSGVVVTNRHGEFRFFSAVDGPKGVCTDTLSNILVCRTSTEILVMDLNGLFLCYLSLNESPGIVKTSVFANLLHRCFQVKRSIARKPLSLSHDVNDDLLWVGTNDSSTVSAYKISSTRENQIWQSKSDLPI